MACVTVRLVNVMPAIRMMNELSFVWPFVIRRAAKVIA